MLVTEVLPEVDAMCENKINILQGTRSAIKNWFGQSDAAIIQDAYEDLEEIPDRVIVGESGVLKIQVKGKKPRCFRYARKGNIKAKCDPAKKEDSLR